MELLDGKTVVAGVDVSQKELVVRISSDLKLRRFQNNAAGIRTFVEECERAGVSLVVCEHTGRHEWHLLVALWDAGRMVHCAHPKAVFNFGRALKANAKSDPIDASVLVEYGMRMDLAPTLPPPAELVALRELTGRREDLNEMLVKEKNRLTAPCVSRTIQRQIAVHIKQLQNALKLLEREIASVVKSSPLLQPIIARLDAEHGVGLVSAATIYASMPELGTLTRQSAAALAGLAPFVRESGQFVGQRKIRGGRTQARTALYMVALTVIRKHDHPMALLYRRLKAAGKHTSIALTAVMRKLVIRLNTVLKDLHRKPEASVSNA